MYLSVVELPLIVYEFSENCQEHAWLHASLLCKINPIIFYILCSNAILKQVNITINRYVLICHNSRYKYFYTKINGMYSFFTFLLKGNFEIISKFPKNVRIHFFPVSVWLFSRQKCTSLCIFHILVL